MSSNSTSISSESVALPIAEAAIRLGVSERTVYRMLKEGKLERSDMSDNRQTIVVLNEVQKSIQSHEPSFLSDIRDIMSGKMAEKAIEALREEMQEKDRLINVLMENQREMILTIHGLQEQLRELSQWVLAEKNEAKRAASANIIPVPSVTQDKNRWLSRLFPRSAHSSRRGEKE